MSQKVHAVFQAFNEHAPVKVYRRNLPHWRQDGATYFVTFRLADSIPRRVLQGWQEDDAAWMKANQSLPKQCWAEYERRKGHRLHLELDRCYGVCLLRNDQARELLMNALLYFHGKRWWVGDFVIMPNHVHGLFAPIQEFALERVLQSVKSYVAKQLRSIDADLTRGKVWQQESYDRLVRNRDELGRWRRYIRENPVKAKLRDGEYSYYCCDWLGRET